MADKSYPELVEAIIQKQSSVLGMVVAVRRARNVPGLEITDDGKVKTIPVDVMGMLVALVEQYKALSGAQGVEFCRQVAAQFRQSYPDLPLPVLLS